SLRELGDEIRYMFKHGTLAWIFGAGMAYILIAVYIIIPNDSFDPRSFYTFGLSAFIGTVGSGLVIRSLYRDLAPITDVDRLLFYIIRDIDNLRTKGLEKVTIVYPALNIGDWRNSAY